MRRKQRHRHLASNLFKSQRGASPPERSRSAAPTAAFHGFLGFPRFSSEPQCIPGCLARRFRSFARASAPASSAPPKTINNDDAAQTIGSLDKWWPMLDPQVSPASPPASRLLLPGGCCRCCSCCGRCCFGRCCCWRCMPADGAVASTATAAEVTLPKRLLSGPFIAGAKTWQRFRRRCNLAGGEYETVRP